MYFHVHKKKYPASPGQHILMFLISFERQMNKAINKGGYIQKVFSEGVFIHFYACVFKLQIFIKL